MLEANQVADYLLSLTDPEEGDIISHLQLQKLLYYAQGFYLAIYDQPLFIEEILAWEHGPVVKTVYDKFKGFRASALPVPENIDFSVYSEDEKNLINEVYTVYGQFSAWRLRQMTHDETPWNRTPRNQIISHDIMKDYFKSQLVDA